MRGFDDREQGWVLVQRRRQRCAQGQGKKGKESEVKKASFVFSNRAFPVGQKASFNSACPTGGCNDKVSSISRPFSVSSAPGRSGLFVTPGARDIRSLSAPGSCVSLGDVFNESVVHGASGFTSGGGCGGSPSRCDPKCGQRKGAMTRSEDDQLLLLLLRGGVGLCLLFLVLRLCMLRWCRRFRCVREFLELFMKLVRGWVVAAMLELVDATSGESTGIIEFR